MTGEDLKDLTKNDLFLFGVSVFKHRVSLMKHFENLTSQVESEAEVGMDGDDEEDNNRTKDEGEN